MKISLNWLSDFIDLNDQSPEAIMSLLSMHTAEVEGVEFVGESIKDVLVAEVLTCTQHPDADKLSVTSLDFGGEAPVSVVCGAPNVRSGLKVAFAPVGSALPGDIKIKKAKLRGEVSFGMICSESELELSDDSEGILELPSDAPVGALVIDYLNIRDAVFEIDNKSLTHRPDLWGHYGFARELSALLDRELKPYTEEYNWPDSKAGMALNIEAEDFCSRYMLVEASVSSGVKSSPKWLQQRLLAVGQTPKNDIVDVSNYVMLELGQPTHAFDAEKISGSTIRVAASKENESIVTIDGSDCDLRDSDYVICDKESNIALAGVMGSAGSEVDETTVKIVLESAAFNPTAVRRTALHHNLRTEASARFEKHLDQNYVELASARFCELLSIIRDDFQVDAAPVFYSQAPEQGGALEVDIDKTSNLLGMALEKNTVVQQLERLGFESTVNNNFLSVIVPSFRGTKDIKEPIDLVEEIGRISGYDKITPRPLQASIEVPSQLSYRKVARRLLLKLVHRHSFHETQSYSLINDKWSSWYSKSNSSEEKKSLRAENPMNDGFGLLRQDPILSLVEQAVVNQDEFSNGRICEFAKGYFFEDNEIEEKRYLSAVLFDKNNLSHDGEQSLIGQAKSIVSDLLSSLSLPFTFSFPENKSHLNYEHPNQKLAIYSFSQSTEGLEVGSICRVHPRAVLEAGGSGVDVAAILIDVDRICLEIKQVGFDFVPPPKFPAIKLDVALALPLTVSYESAYEGVCHAAGDLLESVQLFDVYQGSNLKEGQRSLAFSVVLRSSERTLGDKEEQKFIKKVISIAERLGGNLRS